MNRKTRKKVKIRVNLVLRFRPGELEDNEDATKVAKGMIDELGLTAAIGGVPIEVSSYAVGS